METQALPLIFRRGGGLATAFSRRTGVPGVPPFARQARARSTA